MFDSCGTPWTLAHKAPLSMQFPRQEYWSGLPFPSPGDLPNPDTYFNWHAEASTKLQGSKLVSLKILLQKANEKCENVLGLPWWYSGRKSTCRCRGHEFYPWSGKIPQAAEPLNPCATTLSLSSRAWELQLLIPVEDRMPRACAPQQEKSPRW